MTQRVFIKPLDADAPVDEHHAAMRRLAGPRYTISKCKCSRGTDVVGPTSVRWYVGEAFDYPTGDQLRERWGDGVYSIVHKVSGATSEIYVMVQVGSRCS